jgi:hypothetical protein
MMNCPDTLHSAASRPSVVELCSTHPRCLRLDLGLLAPTGCRAEWPPGASWRPRPRAEACLARRVHPPSVFLDKNRSDIGASQSKQATQTTDRTRRAHGSRVTRRPVPSSPCESPAPWRPRDRAASEAAWGTEPGSRSQLSSTDSVDVLSRLTSTAANVRLPRGASLPSQMLIWLLRVLLVTSHPCSPSGS